MALSLTMSQVRMLAWLIWSIHCLRQWRAKIPENVNNIVLYQCQTKTILTSGYSSKMKMVMTSGRWSCGERRRRNEDPHRLKHRQVAVTAYLQRASYKSFLKTQTGLQSSCSLCHTMFQTWSLVRRRSFASVAIQLAPSSTCPYLHART